MNVTAWTGGSPVPKWIKRSKCARGKEFRKLRSTLFRDQVRVFKDFWWDIPQVAILNTFWNRASLDAWASIRTRTE